MDGMISQIPSLNCETCHRLEVKGITFCAMRRVDGLPTARVGAAQIC